MTRVLTLGLLGTWQQRGRVHLRRIQNPTCTSKTPMLQLGHFFLSNEEETDGRQWHEAYYIPKDKRGISSNQNAIRWGYLKLLWWQNMKRIDVVLAPDLAPGVALYSKATCMSVGSSACVYVACLRPEKKKKKTIIKMQNCVRCITCTTPRCL